MDLGLDTGGYLQPLDDIPLENRITEREDQPRQSRRGSELRAASLSRGQNTRPANDSIRVSKSSATPVLLSLVSDSFQNNVLADLDSMDIDAPFTRVSPSQAINRPITQHFDLLSSSTAEPHEDEAAAQTIAAIRRRRGPRLLTLDPTQELESSVLQAWQTGYVSNMREAVKKKTSGRLLSLVKTNAEIWMWGSGVGGADALKREHRLSSLLEFLRGEPLLASMTASVSSANLEPKPARDEDVPMLDTEQPEIGRAAPTPLQDDTTLDMSNNVISWNLRASQTSVPTRAPRGSHASTPLATLRDHTADPSSLSDSGLPGYKPGDIFEIVESPEDYDPSYRPGPVILTAEEQSDEFLKYIENMLDDMEAEYDQPRHPDGFTQRDFDGWNRGRRSVTFEVMRPAESSTRVQAAEELMHVLGLASRGLLAVEQDEAFGELWLTPAAKIGE